MKKFLQRFFLILVLAFSVSANAYSQALEDVVNSIRNGNITAMSKYFDKVIAITMPTSQSSYSKTQAEIILKDFFTKNTVKDFTIMQSGASGTNSKYAIGKLITSGGNFQTYVLLKLKEDLYLIQEIRFEK
jgi:hypothetical protein